MKIAIPLQNGKLSAHFGHCTHFGVYNVENEKVVSDEMLEPPGYEPGVLPKWLNEIGVTVVLAGGIGERAKTFFKSFGVDVVDGVPDMEPRLLVESFVTNTLPEGKNFCDH